ncbi:MAG: hypothetical protein M5U35_04335 [Roseovarius sp.]|nr:hypothetical protein [Roseovarius sp.]
METSIAASSGGSPANSSTSAAWTCRGRVTDLLQDGVDQLAEVGHLFGPRRGLSHDVGGQHGEVRRRKARTGVDLGEAQARGRRERLGGVPSRQSLIEGVDQGRTLGRVVLPGHPCLVQRAGQERRSRLRGGIVG